MDNCIFCEISNDCAPAYKIWENQNFLAFLDINPVNPGTILVPKFHVDTVFDLDEPLYSELFRVAKKLSQPLQSAMKTHRIGVVIEGFGVAHLHVHLVPINGGGELNPTRATSATAAELEMVARRIRAELGEK